MSQDQTPKLSIDPRWNWPRFAREDGAVAEQQLHEAGCGVACVVMLLQDRGVEVSQQQVGAKVPMPSEAGDLSDYLSAHTSRRWSGGSLSEDTVIEWELIEFITGTRGSWAALLEPEGPTEIGHWVVIDGIIGEGLVLVRDPVGAAYGLPLGDFATLWRYTILVMDQDSP